MNEIDKLYHSIHSALYRADLHAIWHLQDQAQELHIPPITDNGSWTHIQYLGQTIHLENRLLEIITIAWPFLYETFNRRSSSFKTLEGYHAETNGYPMFYGHQWGDIPIYTGRIYETAKLKKLIGPGIWNAITGHFLLYPDPKNLEQYRLKL